MAGQPRDLIVVGASAGGVEALREFAAGLPADLPAAVLVVLHLPPGGASALPAILDRAGPLHALSARDGEPLRRAHLYTAVPDHHLLVHDGRIVLSRGPTENGYRPAVDALFRSAAVDRGPRVIGVVLSGALDDGTAGLAAIKARGGVAVAQDPHEAIYRAMPDNALARVAVDHVLPSGKIGGVLAERVREVVDGESNDPGPAVDEVEARIARSEGNANVVSREVFDVSQPSGLACPDCHGVLHSLDEAGTRYRCRVGHAWTAKALFYQQSLGIEQALWAALRALEEKRDLAIRMSQDADHRGFHLVSARYERHRAEADHAAGVLRTFLFEELPIVDEADDASDETA
ncbi:chemotaxis protein CheB [Amycolatopsis endophytica]|uniref:protein-glutamate methylesterase n=1 Tax=Amycolatopsis endophytica TaxID=860233 RepID=A0A853AWN3_9PSEU|nr:chemotaxis protein CheB [Amycolatopsis endophytica]NYI87049.1 two-component system chemotaxis response regulator CheB [Amycolatopsis endophytica]